MPGGQSFQKEQQGSQSQGSSHNLRIYIFEGAPSHESLTSESPRQLLGKMSIGIWVYTL